MIGATGSRFFGARSRIALLCASSALGMVFATPALAQAEFPRVDANGIDLVRGSYELSFPEGTIGSGEAALGLVRRGVSIRPHQWDMIRLDRMRNGGNVTISIVMPDGTRTNFTGGQASTVFGSTKADGASVTRQTPGYYIYHGSDGTTIHFTDPSGDQSDAQGVPTSFCSQDSQSSCTLVAVEIAEPNGKYIAFQYDLFAMPDGVGGYSYEYRLARVGNSLGYAIAYAYQDNSTYTGGGAPAGWLNLTSATFLNEAAGTQPRGVVRYAYPVPGTVEVTDIAGQVWRVTATSIQRPGDASAKFVVSGTAASRTVTRDGVATTYVRAVSGNTATMTVTDAGNNATRIVADLTVGRPSEVVNALNERTTYTYDASRRLTRTTAHDGSYVALTYDGRGNVTRTERVARPGTNDEPIVSTASYPATCTNAVTCNQPTSTTTPGGAVTNYEYDPSHGGVTRVTAPAPAVDQPRPETWVGYGSVAGVALPSQMGICRTATSCRNGADEVRTTVAYDGGGNVTSVSRGAGDGGLIATTTMTYTAMGDMASVDGPLAGASDTTQFRYDAARRLVGVIAPDPDGAGPRPHMARRIAYDVAGRMVTTEVGTVAASTDVGWSGFASYRQDTTGYDANGRAVRETWSAGGAVRGVTDIAHDALGRITCTARRMNPASWGTMSGACSATAAGADGPDRITQARYDGLGRVEAVTRGVGTAEESTDMASYASGLLTSVTDAEGNLTRYEYDGHGRLQRTRYPSPAKGSGQSSTTDYEQLTYDAGGNVVSRRLRDGNTIAYGYDALGRMSHASPVGQRGVAYGHDLLGNLTEAAYDGLGGPDAVRTAYDALGRVAWSTTSMGGVSRMVSYGYDAGGRRVGIRHPDGVSFATAFDVNGAVTGASWTTPGGTTPFMAVTLDDLGRRTAINRASSFTDYAYDAASRLVTQAQRFAGSVGNAAAGFTYNPAGQIASRAEANDDHTWRGAYNVDRTYGVDGLNRYTVAGGASFTYDARGNLTGDGTNSWSYDLHNRMTNASGAGGTTLSYDPLGRLWQVSSPAYGKTQFLYDGDHVAAEYDGATGAMRRRIFWGPGGDEPILEDAGGAMNCSGTRFLHTDERGSVVAQADCWGNRTAVNTYDEYGIPGTGNTGRYQYTGQAWMAELGLYYYKARMYSPTLGRFMQTDPIGYGDGMNWYDYVGGDPVNATDPSGLAAGTQACRILGYNSQYWYYPSLDNKGGDPIPGTSSPVYDCSSVFDQADRANQVGNSTGRVSSGAKTYLPQNNQCPRPPANRPVGGVGTLIGGTIAAAKSGLGFGLDIFKAGAEGFAESRYPGLPTNGNIRDASRHFHLSFSMSRMGGAASATQILNSIEVIGNNPAAEQRMDTYNNYVGVTMAQDPAFRGKSAAEAFDAALAAGCLITNAN